MPVQYNVTYDSTDPHAQARFWADALDYVVEDHSELIKQLLDAGVVKDDDVVEVQGRPAWKTAAAIRHPEDPFEEATGVGHGRRLLFQEVPEPKAAKNRVHLDLHTGGHREEKVDQLTTLGAKTLWEGEQGPTKWTTMADPEGNEFCVH